MENIVTEIQQNIKYVQRDLVKVVLTSFDILMFITVKRYYTMYLGLYRNRVCINKVWFKSVNDLKVKTYITSDE